MRDTHTRIYLLSLVLQSGVLIRIKSPPTATLPGENLKNLYESAGEEGVRLWEELSASFDTGEVGCG